ncbi:MAG: hypothetical protein HFE73_09685 [Firmicutes bacterium]|nr:hypothetical protein [Bacillota bacterium]
MELRKHKKLWFGVLLIIALAAVLLLYGLGPVSLAEYWNVDAGHTQIEKVIIDKFAPVELRVELTEQKEIKSFLEDILLVEGRRLPYNGGDGTKGISYVILVLLSDGEEQMFSFQTEENSIWFAIPGKQTLWMKPDHQVFDVLDGYLEAGQVVS